jgi:hypothetical protein
VTSGGTVVTGTQLKAITNITNIINNLFNAAPPYNIGACL